ncbi:hypothetical protein [Lysobacter sp. FW306-1B-D06B]|uniref:hypothetical protein n=1 Tax=Lysobacter sp. FW306-1B-D06B TaxID=3140250 RepID=UPI00314030ED
MTTRLTPSQQYMTLIDAMYQDTSDDLDLGTSGAFDRKEIMARAEVRAGKIRFSAARMALKSTPRVAPRELSERVKAQARLFLQKLASQEPALTAKFSLAFRSGKELPDEEVLQILSDLQSLGVDVEGLLDRASDDA